MGNGSRGERLWPYRSPPLQDELLSSWMARLSAGNGLDLRRFCTLLWPGVRVWNRDVDQSGDHRVYELLAARTGVDAADAQGTILRGYEGVVYATHKPSGGTQWVLPLGLLGRARRALGVQFCSDCLAEDAVPYFRRAWRLACVAVCIRHGTPLSNRCPQCGVRFAYHRGELALAGGQARMQICLCMACGFDLRHAAAAEPRLVDGSETFISTQEEIGAVMRNGCGWVPGEGHVHSQLFFTGLRQLVRQFSLRGVGERIRTAACERVGAEPFALTVPSPSAVIEKLPIIDRMRLLNLSLLVLRGWPDTFVEVCASERVWSARLFKELHQAPYWYSRIVREHLQGTGMPPRTEGTRGSDAP